MIGWIKRLLDLMFGQLLFNSKYDYVSRAVVNHYNKRGDING